MLYPELECIPISCCAKSRKRWMGMAPVETVLLVGGKLPDRYHDYTQSNRKQRICNGMAHDGCRIHQRYSSYHPNHEIACHKESYRAGTTLGKAATVDMA